MRPRSLSVACDKAGYISKKFEGVTSDNESESGSDYADEPVENKSDFSFDDHKKLVSQIQSVLPSNDTRKAPSRLKKLDWGLVAFDGYSADTVKNEAVGLLKRVRKHRTLAEMLDDMIIEAQKIVNEGKPKSAPNAYHLFFKDRFKDFAHDNPGMPMKEVFRSIGSEFRTLPSKKKRKYEILAKAAKEKYYIELEKFFKENPDAVTFRKNSTKKPATKTTASVKITPFNLYRKEMTMQGTNLPFADMKKLWETLEFDKKIKYIRNAFDTEPSTLTKNEKSMLQTAQGKPEYVPRTSSEYYLKHYVTKDNTIPVTVWRKRGLLEFKQLSKLRKLEIEVEVRRARMDFVSKYRQYIEKLPPAEKKEQIEYLEAYISNNIGMDENTRYGEKPKQGHSGYGTDIANDTLDLPIAESTTHEVLPGQKRKSKKKTIADDSSSDIVSTPLKSILKNSAKVQVAASPKRKTDNVEAPADDTPSKKKKSANLLVKSESDSNGKRNKKKSKKDKLSDDGVDSSQNGINEETPMKEPKRPPKDILKFYKKNHYFRDDGKHKESFANLSNLRKKAIENEMKTAQKNYMLDLKKYLDRLPPSEVQSYVTKLKQFVTNVGSGDELESGLDDTDEGKKKTNLTKHEPMSDSDDEDDFSDN